MTKKLLSVLSILLTIQVSFAQRLTNPLGSPLIVAPYQHGLKMLNLVFLSIGVFTPSLRIVQQSETMLVSTTAMPNTIGDVGTSQTKRNAILPIFTIKTMVPILSIKILQMTLKPKCSNPTNGLNFSNVQEPNM